MTDRDPGTPDHDTVLAFLQRYYLHTAPEDLAERDPIDVYGAALSHYRLGVDRPWLVATVAERLARGSRFVPWTDVVRLADRRIILDCRADQLRRPTPLPRRGVDR
jgi:hypothetical protein